MKVSTANNQLFHFARCCLLFTLMSFGSGSLQAGQNSTTTPVDVTGILSVIHTDDFERNTSHIQYAIEDAKSKRRQKIEFSGNAPENLRSGSKVRIKGKMRGDGVIMLSGGVAVETLVLATNAASGVQNTLVIIANFSDASVTSTAQQIQDLMFSDPNNKSVDAMYQQASGGLLSFSGKVAGPYRLNIASTAACELAVWADAAEAAARANNIDPALYSRKMIVMPDAASSNCGFVGAGGVGSNPSRAWIFRSALADVYAHELGHNLGMGHAGTPTGGDYGDSSDNMSASGQAMRLFNAPHKEQMGWQAVNKIASVTTTGTYDISALEISSSLAAAPQIIKIAKPDTNEFYYLSYRQPLGFDANISSGFFAGVSLHRYIGNASSANTTRLQVLNDGVSFVDAANGITLTQLSHNADRVSVQIQIGTSGTSACQIGVPALTISPANQSAYAGSTLTYQVGVTNRDSAACAANNFSLAQFIPTGWSGSVTPAALSLAAGASGNVTLVVSSSASSIASTYPLQVNVNGAASSSQSASASGSYSVMAAPAPTPTPTPTPTPAADTSAPSVPAELVASAKRRQVKLVWQAASDNIGVVGYEVWRNGVKIASVSVVGFTQSVANGNYSYAVIAYDAAGNRSALSSSASITVQSR